MEWYTTDCGKYRIESLSAATLPAALEVIRVAFFQEEAIVRACEGNKDPVAIEESLMLCADAALDGVSLVAIEIETGKVVAALFNKLLVSTTTEKPYLETFADKHCTRASSRAIVWDFIAEIDKRCNLFEIYKVDCIFEIMYLATLHKHRNHKLGSHLCRISVDLAKQLKNGPVSKITIQDLGPEYSTLTARSPPFNYPKICTSIWTSESTQKIGKRLNFIVHKTIPFKELMYNGKSYADRIGDTSSFCEIVALPLY